MKLLNQAWMDGWLQSRSSYLWCYRRTRFTWLGEVVDELDGGREGACSDGVLGDLVCFAVAGSGDQSTGYDASNQGVFLREYRKERGRLISSSSSQYQNLCG